MSEHALDRPPVHVDVLRALLLEPAGPLTRIEVVPRTGSTNSDVVEALRADPAAWPDRSLLVAEHQVDGRGRSGRTWETPAGAALTCTFVIRPTVGPAQLGWLPLLAGLGAATALRARTGVPVRLKWPNDLMVPADDDLDEWGAWRKVGGILTELVPLPDGPMVVVGLGVNVSQRPDELPVPSASSLALAGGEHLDRDGLVIALVEALDEVTQTWREAHGDPDASGLANRVAAVCVTLGTAVRVLLPGDRELVGVATGLGPDGSLVVRDEHDVDHRVLAGDVRHVRTSR
ncbi:biotin--[acetyl-CoA-carboxylase] ligase [Cellulomonas soli]|uniref:biotin--[biotin carboxyl-carrier protein] ligase n=1 Tax=Cellulomonas soli TaxID=931535 RepID=A0A512PFM9_9CELL|nr:biotin--[acetyl-CoA-carboxylase] ligase [Cellulomonas soli]NYI59848.1 BirA family biotin operon repressor/biotin-[acetyl-CoA-carboxylase] ligase [Cellulomonas soli]GEP70008.1 biotin--[acetyl-CoA-carboxylase] ligase [Cellulomonas soli]